MNNRTKRPDSLNHINSIQPFNPFDSYILWLDIADDQQVETIGMQIILSRVFQIGHLQIVDILLKSLQIALEDAFSLLLGDTHVERHLRPSVPIADRWNTARTQISL